MDSTTAEDTGAPPPTALSIGDTTIASIGKIFQKKPHKQSASLISLICQAAAVAVMGLDGLDSDRHLSESNCIDSLSETIFPSPLDDLGMSNRISRSSPCVSITGRLTHKQR